MKKLLVVWLVVISSGVLADVAFDCDVINKSPVKLDIKQSGEAFLTSKNGDILKANVIRHSVNKGWTFIVIEDNESTALHTFTIGSGGDMTYTWQFVDGDGNKVYSYNNSGYCTIK